MRPRVAGGGDVSTKSSSLRERERALIGWTNVQRRFVVAAPIVYLAGSVVSRPLTHTHTRDDYALRVRDDKTV